MNTVFVVSAVNGKNLLPAKEFGDLHVILHGGESHKEAWEKLTTSLKKFSLSTDFLLLIGHPMHIAIATHIIWCKVEESMWGHSLAKFLVWDRTNYNYRIERITDGKHQSTNTAAGR